MNIRISHEHGRVPVTVFHVEGQVNLGTADQLEKMARAEYDKGMRNLLIDLSQTTSLTSAGFHALHTLYLMLEDAKPGGPEGMSAHLKLLNPSPDLRRVIQVAGFDSFIEICDDMQTALASFGS